MTISTAASRVLIALIAFSLPSLGASSQLHGQGLTVKSRAPQKKKIETEETASAAETKTDLQNRSNVDDKRYAKPAGVSYSNPVKNRWKIGVKVKNGSAEVRNAIFAFPIPRDWGEQSVSVVEEEIPAHAIVDESRIKKNSGLHQWVVRFPRLAPNEELMITRTFLISTSQIDPPVDVSVYTRPKSRNREARDHMKVSPGINFQDSKLRKQVKEITRDKSNLWEEVESLYDWVRDNIDDFNSKPGPLDQTFKNRKGCNEDKVSLFVGMCRAHKIPARMVWVQGTIYAEFMLNDPEGNGHWFPCNVGGVREFGSYSEPRIVLQKGDNYRIPEKEKTQKYVGEVFQGQIKSGNQRPRYVFFRQLLPANE
ncbi:MAG: transglutaminase domain-containing protein [Planctomycetota bacterium]